MTSQFSAAAPIAPLSHAVPHPLARSWTSTGLDIPQFLGVDFNCWPEVAAAPTGSQPRLLRRSRRIHQEASDWAGGARRDSASLSAAAPGEAG